MKHQITVPKTKKVYPILEDDNAEKFGRTFIPYNREKAQEYINSSILDNIKKRKLVR